MRRGDKSDKIMKPDLVCSEHKPAAASSTHSLEGNTIVASKLCGLGQHYVSDHSELIFLDIGTRCCALGFTFCSSSCFLQVSAAGKDDLTMV